MATFSDLPLKYRFPLAIYRWRSVEPLAWTVPRRAAAAARLALVTSAGVYLPGEHQPFERRPGGDFSFRVIGNETPLGALAIGQTSDAFDLESVERDRNLALPLERLAELVRAGAVGEAAPRHVSFNGSITAPRRLVTQTGPAVARLLREDQVDLALLVPL